MKKKLTMKALAAKYYTKDQLMQNVGGDARTLRAHLRAVVGRLESWGCDNEMDKEGWQTLDIAWGHDLLENTPVKPEEIVEVAGEDVLHCIEVLSNLPGKHANEAAYIQYVVQHANTVTLLVKIADCLCHTKELLCGHEPVKATWCFGMAVPIFQRARDIMKMRQRWMEEDGKYYIPEHYDADMVSVISSCLDDVVTWGDLIGVHWNWDVKE